MRYTSRNLFYLRINPHTIIPLFLHLDERAGHTEWMDDGILRAVIEDMRFLIGPKVQAEEEASFSKKSSGVDVHRGLNYQFGYYLQKADQHHVLLKHKSFAPAPLPSKPPASAPPEVPNSSTSNSQSRGKKRRRATSSTETTPAPAALGTSEADARSSRRTRGARKSYQEGHLDDEEGSGDDKDKDADFMDEDRSPLSPPSPLSPSGADLDEPLGLTANVSSDEEEERNKPKMQMHIRYEGFFISNYKLCLIVQPFPALPYPQSGPKRSESLLPARQGSISPYVTPRDGSMPPPPAPTRSWDRERSVTPAFGLGNTLFRDDTPAPSERGETPMPSRSAFADAGESADGEMALADDTLESLLQLTQSFRGRDENASLGLGLAGNDDVDFDADDDGVLRGDADE